MDIFKYFIGGLICFMMIGSFVLIKERVYAQQEVIPEEVVIVPEEKVDSSIEEEVNEITVTREIKVFKGTEKERLAKIESYRFQISLLQNKIDELENGKKTKSIR